MDRLQIFTHNDAGDDYSGTYLYHVVAYQHGRRIFPDFKDPRDVIEHLHDNTEFSVSHIISPNGKVWGPEEFEEKYMVAVGLIVPRGTEFDEQDLADLKRDIALLSDGSDMTREEDQLLRESDDRAAFNDVLDRQRYER
jgi:hypothetical protein